GHRPRLERLCRRGGWLIRHCRSAIIDRRYRIAGATLLFCLTNWVALHSIPLPRALQRAPAGGIRFTDRNGAVLRESLLDGSRFITPVGIDNLPPHLLAATIAAEDKRLWSHRGVDPIAIAR